MNLTFQNPASQVALQTIDLGSLQDSSGRTYFLSPHTPIAPVNGNGGIRISYDPTTGAPVVFPDNNTAVAGISTPAANASNPITTAWNLLTNPLPEHIGSRLLVGILAIGILLIVAFRLTT